MGIIWAIIIGFIVGIIARVITGGSREPRGFILTTVLGIVGGVVGTWLGQAVGWYGPTESGGFLAAIVGAVIIILLGRLVARTVR
jgi:uncharacterized membrane protein YeaQ/YmgE (transglycosylase-associated protein family)